MNTVPPDYVDFALVRAAKDDNYLNGVSSNDIALIMKHILGLEPFTEPWQFIAADVDGNGVIQTNDLIVLDNLIDGEFTELPDNVSWRFYRSDYVFPPGGNPLQSPVPTAFTVAELLADPSLYFKGVKIGDVNWAVRNSCFDFSNGRCLYLAGAGRNDIAIRKNCKNRMRNDE